MTRQSAMLSGLSAAVVLGAAVAWMLLSGGSDPETSGVADSPPVAETDAPPPSPAAGRPAGSGTAGDVGSVRPGKELRRDGLAVGGVVRNSAGAPITGAVVDLILDVSSLAVKAQEAELRATQTTGSDGRFWFDEATGAALAETERYVLRAAHVDFATARMSPVDPRDASTLYRDVVLGSHGGRIGGFVRDENGAPIVDAEVAVFDLTVTSQEPDGGLEKRVKTDAAGEYRLLALSPGVKRLSVRAAGRTSAGRPQVQVAADTDARFDFRLGDGGAIAGEVRSAETDAPIAGALVVCRLLLLGDTASGAVSGETARRRAASAAEIRRRRAEAKVEAPPKPGSEEAPDDAGAESPENEAERRLRQVALERQQPEARARTDAKGAFVCEGLENGVYEITVDARAHQRPPVQTAATGAVGVVFRMAPQGRIRGRVLDDETGRPVPQFTLGLTNSPDQPIISSATQRRYASTASADGSFEYDDVRPGTWVLVAEAPGYAGGRSASVALGAGEVKSGVEIRVRRGASIRGRVLDAKGAPVAGAVVAADVELNPLLRAFTTGLRRDRPEARTDAAGRFVVANVLDGKRLLSISHPDFSPLSTETFVVPVSGEVDRGDLTLVRGGKIRGKVWLADRSGGDGAATVVVAPAGAAGALPSSAGVRSATTGPDGSFEIAGLIPGTYVVRVSQRAGQSTFGAMLQGVAQGGGAAPVTRHVGADEVVEVDL